ncbi:DUF3237 domain-containing protein [Altererythrobacter sp. MF3-039]|uniref:DUF3237 domain-containing protein n=1 Tax=Altererythrobacter sp. MF3-039 TaxID=3252901 RepID=UPI00390C8AC7
MRELKTEYIFSMQGTLGDPLAVGAGPEGFRQILPVSSGIVEGPRLNGKLATAAGADWARIRSDGSFALDVRIVIEAENGDLIYVTYGGRIVAPNEEAQAIALDFAKPDPELGADRYYFRINPLFETASEKYGWLNGIVAVGRGMSGADGVRYDIFQVK